MIDLQHRNKSNKDRFILLDSCLNKVDTILNVASGVSVVDTYARNNKCILIYRNNLLVAFNSFEKKGEKWGSVIGEILLINMNHTLPHEFKIVDENHIRVKEQSTNKVKLYELNYLEKKVSFTETIDR